MLSLPVLLLVSLLDGGGPYPPRQFHPCTVRSDAGWQLRITPYDPDGLHGAGYELVKVAAPNESTSVWKGTRSYTLRDPILTPRGWTFGTAYVGPALNASDAATMGVIVAIDASGKPWVEDKIALPAKDGTWLGPMLPYESEARLVVRTGGVPDVWDEEWWVYDLNSGKRIASRRPFPTAKNDSGYPLAYTQVLAVVPVTGAPLIVAHGWRSSSDFPGDWKGAGDRWAVFDVSGAPVWSLDDSNDPAASDLGASVDACKRRQGTIASSTVGQFELVRARTKERLTYHAHKDEVSHAWIVEQVARADWVPTAATPKK